MTVLLFTPVYIGRLSINLARLHLKHLYFFSGSQKKNVFKNKLRRIRTRSAQIVLPQGHNFCSSENRKELFFDIKPQIKAERYSIYFSCNNL
jgi:hypothetical protein